MKKLILGILLVVLGLPGTAFFFSDLIRVILGGLPMVLVLGGGLALYLGYEQLQTEKDLNPPPPVPDSGDAPQPDPVPEMTRPGTDEAPAVSKDPPDSKAAPGYTGNTDTLVFHRLSCNFAQGKNCTATFPTSEEALAQGFKPCKVCNP